MAWLRFVLLALTVCTAGCDGDRCDRDEQCFSNNCYYGECGSTLVTVIEHAIEDETEDDDEPPYDDDNGYEPEAAEPPRECRPFSCLNLGVEDCVRSGCRATQLGCGELTDFDCALRSSSECTPECPARMLCSGTPTICDDLDRVACLAERACVVANGYLP